MKYRKLEIVPDEDGLPLTPNGRRKAPTFPPPRKKKNGEKGAEGAAGANKQLTPEEKEVMKKALLKASNDGTKDLPDIPSKEPESEKAKKLREAPDEVIAMALHTMLEKDKEGLGD